MDSQVGVPDQSKASFSNSILSHSRLDEYKEPEPKHNVNESKYKSSPSFSNGLKPEKHSAQIEKTLKVFKQVKINIPLFDAIEQVPFYAKFFKDFCI